MAFCTNCGAKLADDARFCTECGAKVDTPAEPVNTPASTPAQPADAPSYTPAYTPETPAAAPDTGAPAAGTGSFSGAYTPPDGGYSYDPAAGYTPPVRTRDIPGGSNPPKKKSSALPIILIIVGVLVIAAVVAVLVFGGGSDADDPNCGLYTAQYGMGYGSRVEITDMWEKGFTMELRPNGTCKVVVDGVRDSWDYFLGEDGSLVIDADDETLRGTLANGVLTLTDVFDSGIDIVFTKDGVEAPEFTGENAADTDVPGAAEVPDAQPSAAAGEYAWWDGDWYGWWVVYDAGGELETIMDIAFDTCATITVDGDTGLVDIWDVDCDEGFNLGYTRVRFQPGATDRGCMVSVSGEFCMGNVAEGEWAVDPGDYPVSRFENMICIQGTMVDSENSDNWADYFIFLRPWGTSWEDVRADSCEDMPYSDMMPFGYDDWYVPHMNGPMPAYIDIGDEA